MFEPSKKFAQLKTLTYFYIIAFNNLNYFTPSLKNISDFC